MKLISMLQKAHAIEVGAFEAYDGHRRSLKDPKDAAVLLDIQCDEIVHRVAVYEMLSSLGAKPSIYMDGFVYMIGKAISLACFVMPYRMAMKGAEVMEVLGSGVYYKLASEALRAGKPNMSADLMDMGLTEERHEQILKDFQAK